MKIHLLAAVLVLGVSTMIARAQPEMPKPGPEHEKFKAMVGEWDATVKHAGGESKAKSTYKLDFGGFHLIQEFEGEMAGQKFTGRGQNAYCPLKKKYVATWIDSMSPSPMVFVGEYDKDGKVLTETGEGPNQEGKLAKFKSVTKWTDADTMVFSMFDDKDAEMMTITYKRKK